MIYDKYAIFNVAEKYLTIIYRPPESRSYSPYVTFWIKWEYRNIPNDPLKKDLLQNKLIEEDDIIRINSKYINIVHDSEIIQLSLTIEEWINIKRLRLMGENLLK